MNEKDFERIAAIIDAKLETKLTEKLAPVFEALDELKEGETITRSVVNSLLEWAECASVMTKVDFPLSKAE